MLVRRAVAAAAALLAPLALTVAPVSTAPATAAALDPAFQQPVVGSCHDYDYAAVDEETESSPVVDCAGPHTAETIAVVQVPPGASGTKAAIAALTPCYAALKQRLGGRQARVSRTAYDITVFRPDAAQLAQGARWVRCDLLLLGGRSLQPLPTPLLAPKGRIPDSVALCAKGRGAVSATCSRPHTLRAGRALTSREKRYPGRKALEGQLRRCPRGATILYPIRPQWDAGLRTSVCLVPTRR